MRGYSRTLIVAAILLFFASTLWGQRKGPLPSFSPEREAAALTFARLHHKELHNLLKSLKKSDEKEYQQAIRELFRTSETLASIKDRDKKRYELDLREWKLKSRIQLMAARLRMSRSDSMIDELREALLEQQDVRLERLKLDRDRTQKKLDRVQKSIDQLEKDKQARVQRQLKQLVRQPKASPPKKGKDQSSGKKGDNRDKKENPMKNPPAKGKKKPKDSK